MTQGQIQSGKSMKEKTIQGPLYKIAGCFPGWQTTDSWEAIEEQICSVPTFLSSATDHCQNEDKGVNESLI